MMNVHSKHLSPMAHRASWHAFSKTRNTILIHAEDTHNKHKVEKANAQGV